jgi:hypothetical protein
VCGNPQLNRFRTVRHSDSVCRACFALRQAPELAPRLPVGNHMFPVSVPDTQ